MNPQPNFAALIYENRDRSKLEAFDYSVPSFNQSSYYLNFRMWQSLNQLKDYGILQKFYIRDIGAGDMQALVNEESEEY